MRLIRDGKIILDGTLPLYEKEKMAFEKLEKIENLLDDFNIKDIDELRKIVGFYKVFVERN